MRKESNLFDEAEVFIICKAAAIALSDAEIFDEIADTYELDEDDVRTARDKAYDLVQKVERRMK
jgi:hypothetical protein